MANKKTNSNSKKNSSSKKADTKSKPQVQVDKRQDDAMRITGIVIFAFSVIFFCLAVINGDGVWNVLHNVYVGVFGVFAACVFPLISIVVMLFYMFNNSKPSRLVEPTILKVPSTKMFVIS